MVARVNTVAFQGIDVVDVDVQVHIGGGLPAFSIVGLPDKTIGEARERVRAALSALGLALPPKHITVNLSPADLVKEGSHYDLPIALRLLIGMGGPPGSGKWMLAQRLPGRWPPLSPADALEVSMIQSVAGLLADGGISRRRPFRDPHHTSSQVALIGGGLRARPGEVSLAHLGVLFLDELPEFQRATLEALRQPLETGRAVVARANAHLTYPARVQLVAAMNPCRCRYLVDPSHARGRAPQGAIA